ncbi:hypothetical protein BZG36_01525 [Bifiguratus adelaidae]|uniref:Homeobox domain-containing protein n=1 Tax=Bifiguratus adelaidae TaxID=1938954 RepID=A0A261Y4S2_9FUNG|nr:hypothetical protein BZG36_01525 [Bifiguratus adelaidae]
MLPNLHCNITNFNTNLSDFYDPSFHVPHCDFKPTFYNPFEVKHRRRTSRTQFKVLEKTFQENPKPSAAARRVLAQNLAMTPRGVQVWFQNRRAKAKLQKQQQEDKDQDQANDDSCSQYTTTTSSTIEYKAQSCQRLEEDEASSPTMHSKTVTNMPEPVADDDLFSPRHNPALNKATQHRQYPKRKSRSPQTPPTFPSTFEELQLMQAQHLLQRQHGYYYGQNMRNNAVQEPMMQRFMSLVPQWGVMGSMLNGSTDDSALQQSPIPAVSFMRRNSCSELMAPVHPLPNRQETTLSTIPEHEQLPDFNMMRRMSEPQHRPDLNPDFDMTDGRLLSNPCNALNLLISLPSGCPKWTSPFQ